MTLAFVMVCEAEADFRTASGLTDRVFTEDVEWISKEVLDDYRRWQGLDDTQPAWMLWSQVADEAREAGFRIHGPFDGKPGEPDARAARRALWLIQRWLKPVNGIRRLEQVDGVLFIRDDDRQTNRRQGLEQARAESSLPSPVIIGLAHLKRECWVLAGFEPASSVEHARLTAITQELSFDPRTQPERLTAKADDDKRSAKRVLDKLTNSDREREAVCWRVPPLELLRSRGQVTGLADYLEEVQSRLVPLFTGHAAN